MFCREARSGSRLRRTTFLLRMRSYQRASGSTWPSQVVLPVPLGPRRKNELDGSGRRRVNIAIILTVKMIAIYTKCHRPTGTSTPDPTLLGDARELREHAAPLAGLPHEQVGRSLQTLERLPLVLSLHVRATGDESGLPVDPHLHAVELHGLVRQRP